MKRLLLLLLLASPAAAQVHGWPPYYPHGKTVSSVALGTVSLEPKWAERAAVGVAYSMTVTAIGLDGAVTFALSSGTLPTGLSLDAESGVISGTPTTVGSSDVVITATAGGRTVARTYRINIEAGVTYLLSANGDTLYVRGPISDTKDVVQIYGKTGQRDLKHIDTYSAHVVAPAAANTLVAWRAGRMASCGVGYNGSWLSTMHGSSTMGYFSLNVPVVASASHDKEADDVGSHWTDGVHEWVLVAVSGTHLTFYCVPYAAGNIWYMATSIAAPLAWVSGAADTAHIMVDSQVSTPTDAATKNYRISMLANGVTPITAGVGRAVFVDMVEEFDVVNPSTIVTTNNPWDWSDGDVWFHAKHRYRLTAGLTQMNLNYRVRGSVQVAALIPFNIPGHIYNAGADGSKVWDSIYVYVPKTDPDNDWCNYAVPRSLSPATDSYIITPDSLEEGTDGTADRGALLWKNSDESTYDLGLVFGTTNYPDDENLTGWISIRPEANYFMRFTTTGQIYYNMEGAYTYDYNWTTDVTNDWRVTNLYKQWIDPAQYDHNSLAYWHSLGEYDYVYIDFQRAATAEATVLPASMTGRFIEVIDSFQATVLDAVVPATGVRVSTTEANTRGFVVLRLSGMP